MHIFTYIDKDATIYERNPGDKLVATTQRQNQNTKTHTTHTHSQTHLNYIYRCNIFTQFLPDSCLFFVQISSRGVYTTRTNESNQTELTHNCF